MKDAFVVLFQSLSDSGQPREDFCCKSRCNSTKQFSQRIPVTDPCSCVSKSKLALQEQSDVDVLLRLIGNSSNEHELWNIRVIVLADCLGPSVLFLEKSSNSTANSVTKLCKHLTKMLPRNELIQHVIGTGKLGLRELQRPVYLIWSSIRSIDDDIL